jgi:dolichyl-phosphate beta-glucosyltransferase
VSSRGLEVPPHLTIIVPAYNEERRLPRMIQAYAEYLAQSDRWSDPKKVNLLVVNDGSTDSTANVFNEFMESQGDSVAFTHSKYSIALISLPDNQGKGAALAAAIDRINDASALILTTDADGSADVACLEVLFDTMVATLQLKSSLESNLAELSWTEPAMVCGYRTYSDTARGRLLFRWGFRTVVRLLCGDLGTRDSQCGFKLMTATAAKQLYRDLHLTRWSHDVEVLYRAKLLNYTLAEAPVKWQDVDGSKLKAEGIFKVAFRMFLDVCRCRLYYSLGLWSIDNLT